MSQETSKWLNTMTLIGQTDKRGNAWHYRAEDQGEKSNHYPGPIPVNDVLTRLFNFGVIDTPLFIKITSDMENMIGVDDATGQPYTLLEIPGRKAMVTDDGSDVLGIFKDSYQGHTYRQWLLENVATILGDELSISSAGLLRNRAVAWVEVSISDNILTPEGVSFAPNLLAGTSYDGTLASTYKATAGITVCDNTMAANLEGEDRRLKIKHSKKSMGRIDAARDALQLVMQIADSFSLQVAELCQQKVTIKQWGQFLDLYVPVKDKDGAAKEGRGLTMAENKRAQLKTLYGHDDRVSPWAGTAFGVLQACNTWNNHLSTVRKGSDLEAGIIRGMRNMENVLSGISAQADEDALNMLALVTAS